MTIVVSVATVGEGLRRVVVRFGDGRYRRLDQTLWTSGKQRRDRACLTCTTIKRKGDTMYRPMTNALYRAERLCERCVS